MAIGAVALNVSLARQLLQIDNDARTLAESWISRSAALAAFDASLRDFRSGEARLALSTTAAEQQDHDVALHALSSRMDSILTRLRTLDSAAGDRNSDAQVQVQAQWSAYSGMHHAAAREASGGETSAAMRRFREREGAYRGLATVTRQAQEAMLAGADRLAVRNQRSTRTSGGLLAASLLLTVAGIGLANLVLRSRRDRAVAMQRWQDVADQTVGIVWELDRSGRFRFCSRSGSELLGIPVDALLGRHALRFVVSGDRRNALEVARGSQVRDLEVRVVRPDGAVRWLAVSGQRLSGSGSTFDGFRGLAVDITRRAQAEEALAQRRRLEAIGTLAGGVAHDLNNVLTAVNGYAQLMQSELPTSHPAQHDLSAITEAAARGSALVRRVLQFARHSPAQRQAVEVAELVHEVIRLLRPQQPAHVKVLVHLPDTACHVLADATELHQVVLNIVVNALRALTKTGSRLTITVRTTDRDVELTVADDGEGMRPDVLERAFEPFFTTRAVGEGTGMGLAMAHGIVTAAGGRMSIASELGVGTTVRVELPRADLPGVARASGVETAVSERVLRVLFVDDDPQVRNTVTRLMAAAGHEVEAFAGAPAALDALRADPARADVILTDYSMPLMNGMEFTAAVRARGLTLPIVMSSGYLDRSASEEARRVGVTAMLDKPVQTSALLRTLTASVSESAVGAVSGGGGPATTR